MERRRGYWRALWWAPREGAGETSRYAKGASLKVLAEAVSRLDYGFETAHLSRLLAGLNIGINFRECGAGP
jgi:hypothetical protein